MPPQRPWPMTTMFFTLRLCTREFERGGGGVVLAVRRIGRHQVGDVAHDEQLARAGVEDRFGRGAGIAAGDHHGLRRLPVAGELAVAATLGGIAPAHEAAVAGEKMFGEVGHRPRT